MAAVPFQYDWLQKRDGPSGQIERLPSNIGNKVIAQTASNTLSDSG
jgi:hypothetical protein